METRNDVRVPLTIEDPTKGVPEPKRLPGKITLADHLGGNSPSQPQSRPIPITKASFPKLPATIKPSLSFEVRDLISGDPDARLAVDLTFTKGPKQFVAQTIAQVESLRTLDRTRKALIALKTRVRNDPRLARRLKSLLKGDMNDLARLLDAASN